MPLWLGAFLRAVPWYVWAGLAIVVVEIGALDIARNIGKAEGELLQKTQQLDQKAHTDTVTLTRVDSFTTVDTVRLTAVLRQYDTLRMTLNIHDTTEVIRFVAQADSTVRSCRQSVDALALSCAARDTIIRDLTAKLALRPIPSTGASWKEKAAYLAAGLASGAIVQSVRH